MQSLIRLGLINLALGLLTGLGGSGARIDNWAHLGGVIGGVALAWAIGPIYIVRRHPEIPDALLGEDINPLKNRYWTLSVFGIVLMAVLLVARNLG
jgi:hypothetical protein